MNETIFIKKIKHSNFTTVDNGFVRNTSLSWKAKGILLYLVSLPEDWILNLNELKTHASDGISSLRAGINELKLNGYINVTFIKDEKGKFTGTKYEVDEYGMLPKSENLKSDNLISENPTSENPQLLNTDNKPNTNKLNTNIPSSSAPYVKDASSSSFPESEDYPADNHKYEVAEEKKDTKHFKKTDYSECVSLINKCKNTLKLKGIKVDETQWPYSVMSKYLKHWFEEYGVERTKQGIINASTSPFITRNQFKITMIFSDKVFPQLVSTSSNVSKATTQIDYQNQNYSEVW